MPGSTETGAVGPLEQKIEMSPITPITMMPKMICPEKLSSAWLSVIVADAGGSANQPATIT
jgi:hypothetical protein